MAASFPASPFSLWDGGWGAWKFTTIGAMVVVEVHRTACDLGAPMSLMRLVRAHEEGRTLPAWRARVERAPWWWRQGVTFGANSLNAVRFRDKGEFVHMDHVVH